MRAHARVVCLLCVALGPLTTDADPRRLSVLHEMLDMLRSQQNALHSERVELIIIWLIVADCIILLFQLSASLGWVGKGGGGGGGKGPGDLLAALGLPGWGW